MIVCITLAFVCKYIYHDYMNTIAWWLTDYTEPDIDPYAKILDNHLPTPYGFVIPHEELHSLYLPLSIQQKLIPIFELAQESNTGDVKQAHLIIQKIIRNVQLPKKVSMQIIRMYELLLEKEREYLKLHTNDLHRAVHTLKHVYAPVPTKVTFLSGSPIEMVSLGDQGLLQAITLAITAYLQSRVSVERAIRLPSILVQRLTNGQYSGYCVTENPSTSDKEQLVVYANHGAKMLEDSSDVYIVQKDGATIRSRHLLTQPYKYVLKGSEYKKVRLHEEDGARQVLPDSLIMEVAYLAKDIEKKLYFPQKISWTYEGKSLYVTALRQI